VRSVFAPIVPNHPRLSQADVWIQEDATWCGRTLSCLSPGHRATTYRTLPGPGQEGLAIQPDAASLLTHSKGCTNGVLQVSGAASRKHAHRAALAANRDLRVWHGATENGP
jgi:hypothetical protein